jgi:pyruvate/2-oxoglutarate dehydrogenase complex dihydrolipoamide acyltransferase (E2) component
VEIGSEVNPDTVVCIIEAMKVMNEIKAEVKGVITQVLVENAKPVEFGQPLFKIRPNLSPFSAKSIALSVNPTKACLRKSS